MKSVLSLLIRIYRAALSPFFPPRCRFLPTCSDYALQAVERHGALRGGWLALRRIGRCHPFGSSGIDEVPETFSFGCSCRWPASMRGEADAAGNTQRNA